MDPITHTLAGATMARAGLSRRTPLATTTLLLAANAPDIDIVTGFLHDENATLACRRGWTHGPLAMAALPFAVAGVTIAWDHWVRRRRDPAAVPASPTALVLLSVLGVLSHPALDWLNTYGIRLLMPFSDHWYRGDTLFIVDPWLWLILGVGIVLARRLPSGSMRIGRVTGTMGLAYIVAMLGLSINGKIAARRAAEDARIADVSEVLYSPRPGTPLKADVVARTPVAYHPGSLVWTLDGAQVTYGGIVIPRGDWTAFAVHRAQASVGVRNYLAWSQFPYVRVDTINGDTLVFFGDARYRAAPAGSLSGYEVRLSSLR